MKKAIVLLITLVCLNSFVGCNKNQQTGGNVSGGIQEMDEALTDEDKEIFDKALAAYDGENLRPLRLTGRQVVAGTNYIYLCEEVKTGDYKSVTVYEDLQGNCSITNVDNYNE